MTEGSTCCDTLPNGHLLQLTMSIRLKGEEFKSSSLGKHSFHGQLGSGCVCSNLPSEEVVSSFTIEAPLLRSPMLPLHNPLHRGPVICFLSETPSPMMNGPKLHSITPKVRRRRNNGNWPQQCGADPQHSSQQFSLISINSCPIHHTPQET